MQRNLLFLLFTLALTCPAYAQHLPISVQQAMDKKQIFGDVWQPLTDRSGCQIDSVITYEYSSPTDSIPTRRNYVYYYGGSATVYYYYEGTATVPESIDSLVFNASGQRIQEDFYYFNFDSNKLVLNYRILLSPHGNTTLDDSEIVYVLDFSTGALMLVQQSINLFDSNDRIVEVQTSIWDASTSSWQPASNQTFAFTPTGKQDSSIISNWNGQNLAPSYLIQYAYDANDSVVLALVTFLPNNTPSSKIEFTYDLTEHSTLYTNSYWENNTWVAQQFSLNDYDSLGRLELQQDISQFPDTTFGYRTVNIYVPNTNCRWFQPSYDSPDGINWIFKDKTYYYFNAVSATQSPADPLANWSVYPNPTSDHLWLEAPAGSLVRIFDLQGRTLYTGTAQGKERIELPHVQGAFLITVGEGKSRSTRIIMTQP